MNENLRINKGFLRMQRGVSQKNKSALLSTSEEKRTFYA
jgi:hypothetical protein